MKWLRLLLALGLSLTVLTCSKNEDSKSDPEIQSLLRQTEAIQEAINLGRLMSTNTEDDRHTVQEILYDLKIALLRLNQDPSNDRAIRITFRLAQDLSRLPFIRTDKDQMESFTSSVLGTVYKSAERNKVDINPQSWRQFSYQFSNGVKPFRTYATKGNWITDWAQDEFSYTKAEGFGNQAYLVSPEFDLTGIKNPSFKFRHLTIVDDNSKSTDVQFNRDLILANAFKVRVFVDGYTGDPFASPFEAIDDFGPIPVGINFETLNSPEVDLRRFEGRKIRLAFFFDMNQSLLGSHYVSWQIYKFDLYGVGQMPTPVADNDGKLLEQTFTTGTLKPFVAFKADTHADGEQWVPANFRGKNYAKIFSHQTKASDAFLVSPRYDFTTATELNLTVREVLNNATDIANFAIWISEDYNGGPPALATWKPLVRPTVPPVFPDWRDNVAGPYDLTSYIGKKAVLGFQYKGAGGSKTGWELEAIVFQGKGDEIRAEPL